MHPTGIPYNIMKRGYFLFLLVILAFVSMTSLYSYQLTPLTANYETSGVGSANSYTIVNDSDSPIAIQIKVMKRGVNSLGEEVNEEAPNYFSVQPEKMIIQPQSTQIVRVQYRGPKTVTKETAFRIIAEQIPYNTGKASSENTQMINFLFVYSTSAYVLPSRQIVDIQAKTVVDGDKATVTISNEGTMHQILSDLAIEVSCALGSYKLTEEQLGNMKGLNLLTDSSVEIAFDLPANLKGTEYLDTTISY
jgi:fimbrial chaperone protein